MKILFGILILILLEELVEYWYKKKTNSDIYRFRHMPKQLEICNIGSGPGRYGITYEDCPWTGFNMSTAPQSFFYGYKILKHYSNRIQKNAVVMIVIMSPLSFGNNQDYNRKDYDDIYYGLIPKKDINHFSIWRSFLLSHPFLIKGIKKFFRMASRNRNRIQRQSKETEPKIISLWKSEFQLQDLKNAEQSKKHREAFMEKIKILSEEIAFCYQKNWRPVLVIPPVPEHIREYISDEFVDRFVYQNIDKVQKQFSNLKLLDYYKDFRFPETMFQSDVFMNEDGRKYYSKILFDDIDAIMKQDDNHTISKP